MKIFIAATSGIEDLVRKLKPKYILESFYSIKEWQVDLIKSCDMFLLDSGAFSFMGQMKKNKNATVDFDKYLDSYIKFINDYDVDYFFELDVDVIVGYEKVKQMRRKLEKETGKKCIPVWHKNRGLDEYIKLCKEYDYIAIGASGKNDSGWTKKNTMILKRLLQIASENRCKVHGLGFTRTRELQDIHFFSVDSTTWTSGSRYGQLNQFDGKKILKIRKPNARLNSKSKEVLEYNLKQWIEFQKYADRNL